MNGHELAIRGFQCISFIYIPSVPPVRSSFFSVLGLAVAAVPHCHRMVPPTARIYSPLKSPTTVLSLETRDGTCSLNVKRAVNRVGDQLSEHTARIETEVVSTRSHHHHHHHHVIPWFEFIGRHGNRSRKCCVLRQGFAHDLPRISPRGPAALGSVGCVAV